MLKLYFRTSNRHKYLEAKEILSKYNIDVEWINKKYREIQADSLEEVVLEALKNMDNYTFIEDAGLFIDALNGFPGVYSSFVFKKIGNEGILKLMEDVENRRAKFVSVVGLKINGEYKIFKGVVEGYITHEIRGKGGFGYDPIFIPNGYSKTFAEDTKIKNEVSHRRRALEELAKFLRCKHGKDTCT